MLEKDSQTINPATQDSLIVAVATRRAAIHTAYYYIVFEASGWTNIEIIGWTIEGNIAVAVSAVYGAVPEN